MLGMAMGRLWAVAMMALVMVLAAGPARADRLRVIMANGSQQDYEGVTVQGIVRDAAGTAFVQAVFPDGKAYPIPLAAVLTIVFGTPEVGRPGTMLVAIQGQPRSFPGTVMLRYSSQSMEVRAPGRPESSFIPIDQLQELLMEGVTALAAPTPAPTPTPVPPESSTGAGRLGGAAAGTTDRIRSERDFQFLSDRAYHADSSSEWRGRARATGASGPRGESTLSAEEEAAALAGETQSEMDGPGEAGEVLSTMLTRQMRGKRATNGFVMFLVLAGIGLIGGGAMVAVGIMRNRRAGAAPTAAEASKPF